MSEAERSARGKGAGSPARLQSLPKRFYKTVTVASSVPAPLVPQGEGNRGPGAVEAPTPSPSPPGGEESARGRGGRGATFGTPQSGRNRSGPGGSGEAFRVLLDGKPMRTPAKRELALPTRALAAAIAAEWEAQGERIDPSTMPLTKLANSAIDGVAARADEVRADIAKYVASDLLCYRAARPAELVRRQAEAWDPVLAWSAEALGLRLVVAEGLMPVAQPEEAPAILARRLEGLDAFALAAVHVMATLMGSALLALAHAERRLDAAAAWAAAHIDEDFQAEQWGVDAQAQARRDLRSAEMQAASRLLHLLAER